MLECRKCERYSVRDSKYRNFVKCRESRKMGMEAVDGEELLCELEPHNNHDRYVVAVKKKGGIHVSCQLWPLRVAPFQPPDSPSQSHEMANWLIVAPWDLEARFLV